MRDPISILLVLLWLAFTARAGASAAPTAKPAKGPLRVHPSNGRYFSDGTRLSDGSLKAVYLTGSHTWANLIDRGPSDPPPVFSFDAYLDLLQRHNHNFIRLWTRHVTWYHGYGSVELHAGPLAWPRSGPGNALDGKPRFDLARFDPAYFERLRSRVTAARDRGIYVSVMLFGGSYECRGGWPGNPFHAANNINGIDGDPGAAGHGFKVHTLEIPRVNELQTAYVRKVADTLSDLENVLYEISNEGDISSLQWQEHWVRVINGYERQKQTQHPVGMTAFYVENASEDERVLRGSPAVWISPFTDAAGVRKIKAADGTKVSILDSDHWFVKELYNDAAFGREWVWKAFCRGHNPILMEHLSPVSFVDLDYPLTHNDAGYTASRQAMKHTREYAERMGLAGMQPGDDVASTGFCLVNPGKEYLVYQPEGGASLHVKLLPGVYDVEWFDPAKGATMPWQRVKISRPGGEFKAPWAGEAVLYLKSIKE